MTTPAVIIDRYRAEFDGRAISGLCTRARREAVRSRLTAVGAQRVRFAPLLSFRRAVDGDGHRLILTPTTGVAHART